MNNSTSKTTFFHYVSLNIIGMIGLSCYILADTFFVARGIGANGLSSLNLAIPIYSFLHGTGLMFGMGSATRFSISKSEKAFTQAFYYVFLTAFVFVIVGLFLSPHLAALLGANADTLQNTTIYLKVILCFSPMFLLNNVVICFVRNDNNPKLSMLAMLIGSLSNIILDYVFIFPCKMGMFGAAFATGIAPVVSLLVLSTHFLTKKNTCYLVLQKMDWCGLFDVIRLGISAFITEFSSGIVIIVFNSIILTLEGNLGVAAYGIIANIALVVMSIFTGIAQGIQPILSQSYREQKSAVVKETVRYAILTALSISIVVYAASVIFVNPIVAAFNKDANTSLAQIATTGLFLYFTAFVFVGINIICASYFSSIDKPQNAFVISLLRGFLVIVPVAFLLSFLFGMYGIWISVTVTEFLVSIISLRMLLRKH